MIYSDKAILKHILKKGYLEGADPSQINPASVNLRLGDSFLRIVRQSKISLGDMVSYTEAVPNPNGEVEIPSGDFILATTIEKITMPRRVAAFVQGRSSIGRIGLSVQNAGFVDPGFFGHITLELKNDSPQSIFLRPGYPVAQLVFFKTSAVANPYHGKYNGQIEATGSRMYLDMVKGV